MATMHSFPAGHRLLTAGDTGNEMYVVIEGEMRASVDRAGGRIVLATHGRGDVVGEVAPFYGKRTADVDTVTPVRLMRITRATLERLRRRYPRIGAQVLLNLSEILAGRVASSTGRLG
jgi:CRP-like cAMP-binding protein